MTLLVLASLQIEAKGSSFVDEQVYSLPMPTQEAGYLGAFVDDSLAFVFSSYNFANTEDKIFTGQGYPCYQFNDQVCSKYPRFTYNLYLPPCTATISNDCIVNVLAIDKEGREVKGTLQRAFPALDSPNFFGDASRKLPDGWYPTIWKFEGVNHSGGSDFLLRASLFSFGNQRSDTTIRPQLRVSINGVTIAPSGSRGSWVRGSDIVDPTTGLMSAGGAEGPGCNFFLGVNECATPWTMPLDVRFKIEVKISSQISGWVNGRLSDPRVSITPAATGQTISIEASPMPIPIFAIWKKFADYPQSFRDFNQNGGGNAGRVTYPSNWRSVFSGNGREPFDLISVSHLLNNYDQKDFAEFEFFLAASDDRAIATKNLWHFESLRSFFQEGDLKMAECSSQQKGLSGFVSTNSTMFLASPPKFNQSAQTLDYQVSAPHYDREGKENIGRYNLVINSSVARCLYQFSSAPIQASVSIMSTEGAQQIATSSITEKDGWLYLSAVGFKYSAPTLRVKLTQESPVVASASNSVSKLPVPKPKAILKVITCTKGKTTRFLEGKNPKCPKGYRLVK